MSKCLDKIISHCFSLRSKGVRHKIYWGDAVFGLKIEDF